MVHRSLHCEQKESKCFQCKRQSLSQLELLSGCKQTFVQKLMQFRANDRDHKSATLVFYTHNKLGIYVATQTLQVHICSKKINDQQNHMVSLPVVPSWMMSLLGQQNTTKIRSLESCSSSYKHGHLNWSSGLSINPRTLRWTNRKMMCAANNNTSLHPQSYYNSISVESSNAFIHLGSHTAVPDDPILR
jgi:hypothetical protein